ncbi:MAG: GTP-binding protein [Chloroflexota bacterium]|nr:MAG: GTP-binding protein [Chloroflexota bacterium]
MPITILDERQSKLLAEERHLLEDLRELLARFEASAADLALLRRASLDLDELFLLVVVGEFNAGKSAFINALLGEAVLPEGVTPTTTQINLLRHGSSSSSHTLTGDVLEIVRPVPFLGEVTIVDTPGTNAVIRRHEEITREFVPRSDLVLFVTSADRPFTESERLFLERIREWGKKVVLVLNKVDLFASEAEIQQVDHFIADHARALLGFAPEIFPLSARLALRAKQMPESAERQQIWEASRFGALELYVYRTLDNEGRVRLKLLSPLGVAERLSGQYLGAAEERLNLLAEDDKTVANIEAQLALYSSDMRRDFLPRLMQVENVIYELNERGDRFFDETLRLGRILDLFNAERIRGQFEREVLADTSQRIDRTVQELIDWMVDQDLRLWQAVMDYLSRRRQASYGEHIIGEVGGSFEYNRQELLQSVGRTARDVIDSYDREGEARHLAGAMRDAVAHTALAEIGAVSLGTAIAVLVGTAAADITGLLAAGVLAGLGLIIIPARKRQAQRKFHAKSNELRLRLSAAMREQFEHELAASQQRIRDAVAPYSRFVRAERAKVVAMRDGLLSVRDDLARLRSQIEG